MTDCILRDRRTNYHSYNLQNHVVILLLLSLTSEGNEEKNAGRLAGSGRPIVTKRGPMVHGIQFYISRVLKTKEKKLKIKVLKKEVY